MAVTDARMPNTALSLLLYLGLLVQSVDLLAMAVVVDVCVVMRREGKGTGQL